MESSASAATSAVNCTLEGNNNLYGLGIRISIYIQLLISSFAYIYSQGCFESISTSNSILRTAMLIGVTYYTATSESVTSIEVAITSLLCWGIYDELPKEWVFKWYLPKAFTNNEIRRFLKTTKWWRNCAQQGWLSLFSIWFWRYGVGGVLKPANPHCGPEMVWFFAKVRLDSEWLKIIMMVVLCCYVAIAGIAVLVYLLPRRISEHFDQDNAVENFIDRWKKAVLEYSARFGVTRIMWRLFADMAPAAVFILVVELAISWNNITGVNSLSEPDQLIPFLVSLGNLYALWMDWGNPLPNEDDRCLVPPEERESVKEASETTRPVTDSESDRPMTENNEERNVREERVELTLRPRSRLRRSLRRESPGDVV